MGKVINYALKWGKVCACTIRSAREAIDGVIGKDNFSDDMLVLRTWFGLK